MSIKNPAEQSQDKYKQLVDSLRGIVWEMDVSSRSLKYINNAVETLLGYTVEECMNPDFWMDIVHPEDYRRLKEGWENSDQEPYSYDTVLRRRQKNGEYLWLRELVNIAFEDHKMYSISGMSLDATYLIQQREEQQRILDSVPAMVFYKDRDNRILHVNTAAAQSIGKPVHEIIGRPTRDFYPDEADKYFADDLQVIQSGVPKLGIIEQVLVASGEKKWVQTDKIPYRDPDGRITGVIVFAVDITDKKLAHDELLDSHSQVESSLKESEARFENLAKHLPGVIYQFVIHKDGRMSFPYISESCLLIMEYEREVLQGDATLCLSTIHEEDRPRLDEAIEDSLTSMEVFKFEGRIVTRSGKIRWIQASSTPEILENGDILWNGMMMDISDLKSAQEKIKQLNKDLAQRVGILAAVNRELELLTHKLEVAYDQALQASKLKSEFVANISHEVRTPISAVIGMSELLLDTALTEEQKQFAKIVRESAESLLTIINDILDFSKIEAGKIELESIEFSISSILESCAELLSSSARRKVLELITVIDPSIPPVLSGDPVRLRQILLNLTSNAIKFTDRGEVVLRAIKVSEDFENTILRIEVSDTGIGLSDDARRFLFQPFVQADGSTTRRYGGTGLGLSISKRLVELMGGTIGVDSSEGEGSTFWFTVPFKRVAEAVQALLPGSCVINARVLVVDQAPASRLIVQNYLTSAAINNQTSTTPEDTLLQLHNAADNLDPYDVVIMNLSNESINVFQLAREILDSKTLASTSLVLLTPFDEREKIKKALEMGFATCLTKPIRQSQLIEAIHLLTRGKWLAIPGNGQQTETTEQAPIAKVEPAPDVTFDALIFPADKPVLLAEDNPVMQELAVRQLKKMGITAHAVSNGRQAVDAAREQNYAMILMDCQMPEMDGFEATRAIRNQELTSGAHIPIIAMTASAMRGDRETCIAAGMDDYLSKPVGKQQLISVLQRWLSGNPKPIPATIDFDPEREENLDAPLDVVKLKALYGEQGMPELLDSFLTEGAKLLKSIRHYLSEHNDKDLATEAHQLKGLSAVMTAEELEKLSQQLERAAKQCSWEQAAQALEQLETVFDTVTNFIKRLLA